MCQAASSYHDKRYDEIALSCYDEMEKTKYETALCFIRFMVKFKVIYLVKWHLNSETWEIYYNFNFGL